MAILLGEVIQSVRLRHPAYSRDNVPVVALASALGLYQRVLAQQGTRRYSGLLNQRVPILLDLSSANTPGEVAAGSSGGLPSLDGAIAQQPAGSLSVYDFANAVTVLDDFVPTGVTASTVTLTGAGRTVNGDVALALWIVQGPGAGPEAIRFVQSNTATVWTLSDDWTTLPVVDESVIRLIQVTSIASGNAGGVVTELPATQSKAGYLVRLDANGDPYIDTTKPLVATLLVGIPLPDHDRLLGLDLIRAPGVGAANPNLIATGAQSAMVPIYHHNRRDVVGRVAWVIGKELHLGGVSACWTGIRSLELSFVPIPPLFDLTSRDVLDTPFLLPDSAYGALCGWGYYEAARHCAARGVNAVDPASEREEALGYASDWLGSLGQRASALVRVSGRNR